MADADPNQTRAWPAAAGAEGLAQTTRSAQPTLTAAEWVDANFPVLLVMDLAAELIDDIEEVAACDQLLGPLTELLWVIGLADIVASIDGPLSHVEDDALGAIVVAILSDCSGGRAPR